jgi:hypothetical protein
MKFICHQKFLIISWSFDLLRNVYSTFINNRYVFTYTAYNCMNNKRFTIRRKIIKGYFVSCEIMWQELKTTVYKLLSHGRNIESV